MNKLGILFLILSSFIFNSRINAHVHLVNPKGGETFIVNEKVLIKWQEQVHHGPNNWDLFFSTDGGNSWEVLEENIVTSQTEYEWTIPNSPTQSAEVRVVQDNSTGDYEDASGNFTITQNTTAVNNINNLPQSFALFQNYPNPFNPTTKISFTIPSDGKHHTAYLRVYDILGKERATLVNGNTELGKHEIEFNAAKLPSGVYFYTLKADNFSQSKKMLLIK